MKRKQGDKVIENINL